MIADKQNDKEAQKLLKARQQLWYRAQHMLVIQMVLTVLAPVVAAIVGLVIPSVRPYGAALSIAISVLDAALLDRTYRTLIKKAARASEQFDCCVLEMPWNEFVVGKKLDPEVIHEEVRAYEKRAKDSVLKDWYSPAVAKLPLHLGRIVCQRTNLWYDSKLRTSYSNNISIALAIVFIALFLAGLWEGLTLSDFVLSILAPIAPLALWSIREFYRQRDTAVAQDLAKSSSEAFWAKALTGAIGQQEIEKQSRDFQDAIFNRRSSSPLLPPGIYWTARKPLEEQMNVGAEALVEEYMASVDGNGAPPPEPLTGY